MRNAQFKSFINLMGRSGVLGVVLALLLVGVVLASPFAMAFPSILWFAAMRVMGCVAIEEITCRRALGYSSWLRSEPRQVS
jgi:hypothetical protein